MVKFESYICNMDLHSTFGLGYLYSLFFLCSIPLAVDKLRLLIFSHVENKVSQLLDKHIFKRFFE